ncbi:MAG: UDP-glucose 4-epimerase GalE [Oscillospiraceae bacterium]|nr:UDP-glucose 4-epimerase GalE [Oscillospiraceae bacterium]
MAHIVVTGGAGFIGSHCCVELLQKGEQVTVLDNFCNSSPEALDAIEKITGVRPALAELDLCDEEKVNAFFAANTVDAVVHFAGLKAVGESCRMPLAYYHNNLTGTLNLLRAMAANGCKTIVFSSSATVYGMHNNAPFTEDMPTSATNPYGWTKQMIEQMLMDTVAADAAWSVVALRYFNPIGAHPSGLIGENPNGIPNNLVPYVARVAEGTLERLSVYGDDYDTPDGTGVRDYIHVVDLAKGHLCALDYAAAHKGFEAINLGTGNGASVMDVLHAYEQACGKTLPYVIAPRRPGDIATSFAAPQKAKELLHWEAQSDLLTMCRDSWNYMCRRQQNG